MDDQAFRDNVVVITGASSGIGSEVALQLADQGARLVLAARGVEALEDVAERCRRRGADAVAVPTDIAEPDQCSALIDQTVDRFGRLDTLINNAGVGMISKFRELPDMTVFEQVVRVDLFGAVYCTHHALRHLEASRGRLVFVNSQKGLFNTARADGYTTSKHALTGFFGSLRNELARTGVTVTIVCLPWVHTGVSTRALTVHGEPYGALSRHERGAMSPQAAAELVIESAARRTRMAITPLGRFGLWLTPFAPRLVDTIVRRQTD